MTELFSLGQSNERIRDVQRVMAGEGYRAVDGAALVQDGVYRPNMQGALLDFQRDHGLPQTGISIRQRWTLRPLCRAVS
ncbi:peptidoglycan-binding protein [Xanthomonas campestris pv. phormiicola]|nr:peptidoglycan-binding protein [Xanthomonas campestris pv. phormiicola]